VLGERVSFGTLFAFIAYIEMFFVPIRDLSAGTRSCSRPWRAPSACSSCSTTSEEADAPPTAGERDGAWGTAEGAPAVELDATSPSGTKPNSQAPVRDVSLSVAKGEKIALVGATGAGKSTVPRVLLRLYEVRAGSVGSSARTCDCWDGRAAEALRGRPAGRLPLPRTVATNIAAGDPSRPSRPGPRALDPHRRARSVRAARGRHPTRPCSSEARTSPRASASSSPSRARSTATPDVLVLDEATANVDSDTEARLQRALDGAMTGRTALVIAHRLSTIRAADRIVVFHKGKVVESGTHAELLAAQGVYARLHALQFAREHLAELGAGHGPRPTSAAPPCRLKEHNQRG
jgi:ATP-binding cassette subfamily B multidrug efflux pump